MTRADPTARPAGTAGSRVAVLEGAVPPAQDAARLMDLREGDVFQVGRRDSTAVRRAGLRATHLGLGRETRAAVSMVSLILSVSRASVLVTPCRRPVHILIDGVALSAEPVNLAGPVHEILVDALGLPQRLRLGFGPADPRQLGPVGASSGTLVPVLRVHGSRLRPMAAALAWPLVSEAAPALMGGWSTTAVTARYHELWGMEPVKPRRSLHDLRQLLVGAWAEDGRSMAAIPELAPWPWAERWQDSVYTSAAAFAEGCNQVTALYLAATSDIATYIGEALDRPRGR